MNREQLEHALRENTAVQFRGIEVGDGWISLVSELHQQLKNLDPTYEVIQVKEKFGILRFYFHTYSSKYAEMDKITSVYEGHSGIICEFCGGFGKEMNFGGWLKTSCNQCFENWAKTTQTGD